jgi:hypothetical protein
MRYEHEQGTTGSRAVTITLDPDDKQFGTQFAAFESAATEAEMAALGARWPKLVERTVKTGATAGSTTGMGGGPVTLEITEKTASEQSRTTGAKGTTYGYTGSTTLGAGVKVGPLPKVGSSTEEKATAAVTYDAEGELTEASVDVGKTHTDTHFSLKDLQEKIEKDRLGLIAGGAKLTDDSFTVSGIRLTRADLDALVRRAGDRSRWMKACARPALLGDWEALGQFIANASGPHEVAAALTVFTSLGGYDRVDTVQRVIRAPGKGETTGVRYEFPPSIAEHRAAFDELVLSDPLETPRELIRTGETRAAAAELRRIAVRLAALVVALQAPSIAFANVAARGEMVRRTVARQRQVAELERSLAALSSLPPDPAAEYDRLLGVCRRFKEDEQATFAAMAATYHGTGFFGLVEYDKQPSLDETVANADRMQNLLELYAQWEPELAQLRRLGGELRRPPSDADALAPDRVRYARFRQEGSIQTATGRPPT